MQGLEADRVIGRGHVAEVFAHGEMVLKLYLPNAPKLDAFREAATLAALEPLGLPAPRVGEAGTFDGRWGLTMTRAQGRPFYEAILADPAAVPAHLEAMVEIHRQIHGHTVPTLPSHRMKLAAAIGRAKRLDDVARRRLLASLDALPQGDRLCHLDFHPLNVLGTPGRATVVDWLDASLGDPAADVCRSYAIIRPAAPELADAYVAAYAQASGIDPARIFAWLPVIAGARLAEGVTDAEPYLLSVVAGEAPP